MGNVVPDQEDTVEEQSDSDQDLQNDNMLIDLATVQTTTPWTLIQLTGDVAQMALESVRYNKNYNKSVTSRLCLHYINTVRLRLDSNLAWFLLSVDGCEVVLDKSATGRCDIYNIAKCASPFTYELKLQQRTVRSSVFMVVSVFKVLIQKPLALIKAEASNLDFSDDDEDYFPLTLPPTFTSKLQLDAHLRTEPSISSNIRELPQPAQSLASSNSPLFVAAFVGILIGIMVLARVGSSRTRAAKPGQGIHHSSYTKSNSQPEYSEYESNQGDL